MGLSLKHDDDNINTNSGNTNQWSGTSFKDIDIPQSDADVEKLMNRLSGEESGSTSTYNNSNDDFNFEETPYINTTLYSDLKSVQKAMDARGMGEPKATSSQIEAQGKKMFIWTVVLIVGLMIVGGIIIQKKAFLQHAHTTDGEITKVVRNHRHYRRRGGRRVSYSSYVGYEVNGVYYERYWNTTSYGLAEGTRVTVYYDPANPGKISDGRVMTYNLWFALIAVIIAIGYCGVLSYKAYHGEDISRFMKIPNYGQRNNRFWRF